MPHATLQQPAVSSPLPQRHIEPEATRKQQPVTLRSAEFRKGRENSWQKLDAMVTRVEAHGISALSTEEAQRFPLLYRATMSSLSVARTIVLDRNLLLYLENLSLRAYLAIYGPRTGILYSLSNFLKVGFPQLVRSMRWHLAIAFLALAAGVIAGYLLVAENISYFSLLVPDSLAQGRGPSSSATELKETLFSPWQGFVQTFVVFANSLFRHNALIGILSFGLGFSLGIPTLLLLIYNGLIIGAFIALFAEKNLAGDFIGWLAIHGVTEILAILLCGAAGLVIAQKILFPGSLPRLENLARYGRHAASVVAGAVLLFFIAGFLEGGFRQLINSTPLRYTFALATGIFWCAYFLSGRKETPS